MDTTKRTDPNRHLTFAMVKPHAMGLKDTLIKELANRGFKIVQAEEVDVVEEVIREHYIAKKDEDYYEPMVQDFVGQKVYAMLLEYESPGSVSAALALRRHLGPTDPRKANPEDIRYLFHNATEVRHNGLHASDDDEDTIFKEACLWLEDVVDHFDLSEH